MSEFFSLTAEQLARLVEKVINDYKKKTAKSAVLYDKISKLMPGGVGSNFRYFKPYPFYITRGDGSRIYDVDGNEYIDYNMNMAALLFGHARPKRLLAAIKLQLDAGIAYGIAYEGVLKTSEKLCKAVPCAEMIRYNTCGTEAIMNAIRYARAYNGRKKIIKFEGAYHGSATDVFVSQEPSLDVAGSYEAPNVVPESAGIPEESYTNTIVTQFNNAELVEATVKKYKNEIAAIIVEPVMQNCGVIPPKPGFLPRLREITEANDIVLIFDEIQTGFRLSRGGAQEYFKVMPDLAVFGKTIGGGLPIGIIVGSKEILSVTDPSTPGGAKATHTGTFNANPLVVAAISVILDEIDNSPGLYERLERLNSKLIKAIDSLIKNYKFKARVQGIGSVMQVYFTDKEVVDYRTAKTSSEDLFNVFRLALINRGIYIPKGKLSRWALSASHTDEDIDRTTIEVEKVFRQIKEQPT